MSEVSDDHILAAYKKYGSERLAAASFDPEIPKSTFHDRLASARENIYRVQKMGKARGYAPYKRSVRRFILMAAQNLTAIHEPFMDNLEAYAKAGGMEIIASGFTYNKRLFEDHGSGAAVFHERVAPYITDKRVKIGPNLDFCAERNQSPVNVNPLSGLKTYTEDRDGIFPHAKVRLESVATMKHKPSKINMTTGVVSLPNYVQKAAGQKAEFHHVIGAVIVELMPNGDTYARHLLAEEETGTFEDLIWRVENGVVMNRRGHTVDAINYGDSHFEKSDEVAAAMSFGQRPDSLLNFLRPKHQFFHDATDFSARNHHNLNDPHFMFKMYVDGTESVRRDAEITYEYLSDVSRDFCQTHITESNHHEVLDRWLKSGNYDYRKDPVNAVFFLECQLAKYKAIEQGVKGFDIYEHVLTTVFGDGMKDVHFIEEDGTFTLHGIEFGLHGHRGTNGARGGVVALSNVPMKINMGHVHGGAIVNGVYAAGITCKDDLGYNKGLSNWNHTNVLTYSTSKRTLVTMKGGIYHAPIMNYIGPML